MIGKVCMKDRLFSLNRRELIEKNTRLLTVCHGALLSNARCFCSHDHGNNLFV